MDTIKDQIELSDYRKIIQIIIKESLKISSAKECLVLFGTNKSKQLHLPIKEWDRAEVYKAAAPGIFGFVPKLKVKMAQFKKHFPMPFFLEKDNKLHENYGIISYLFNRCTYFYRMGITILYIPEVQKYITNTAEKFVSVPIYIYDGENLKPLEEPVKIRVDIVKISQSRNFVSLHIPHFGILELNNVDQSLFEERNESLLKTKFNKLIRFMNEASLSYFNEKGKFIDSKQKYEELIEKEEILRTMGARLKNQSQELEKQKRALDEVAKEKYELQLKTDALSREVLQAQQTINEMQKETESNLASIAHTAKNMYMSQKSFAKFLLSDIQNLIKESGQLHEFMRRIDAKYPKLNHYQFWQRLQDRIAKLKTSSKTLEFNNNRTSSHMIQVMEYILSVLAYQRGTEYNAEGIYFSNLMKVLKHIRDTHGQRLENLGIEFTYTNRTKFKEILLDKIYHFHLTEDIFINLITNSIRALSDKKEKKRIWIDIYEVQGNKPKFAVHYRDNGKGIPPGKKEAIFTGWSTKNEDGVLISDIDRKTEHGVGGKTIMKRVTNAGGTIKEVGLQQEGAHFIITMNRYIDPDTEEIKEETGNLDLDLDLDEQGETMVTEPEEPAAPDKTSEEKELEGKNILIVDDDEMIRRYIASIFQDVLTPLFATGHEEAWDHIYGPEPPDIITLDLDLLSSEKGENLLFDFNMRGVTRKIPVVVVSGADRAFEVDKLKKLGALEVFQKPVKEEALKAAVYKILLSRKK